MQEVEGQLDFFFFLTTPKKKGIITGVKSLRKQRGAALMPNGMTNFI